MLLIYKTRKYQTIVPNRYRLIKWLKEQYILSSSQQMIINNEINIVQVKQYKVKNL